MDKLYGSASVEPVLDPAQLIRIEATHRGFGYQHLYTVACMLAMTATATEAIVVEHDEDVELIRAESHVYLQVKTRNRPLRFSDLGGVLPRFAQLRGKHAEGSRPGTPSFAIVSNTAPGPELHARLLKPTWPSDVVVLWPSGADLHAALGVPAPWLDLGAALRACTEQAALVPFPSLAPETLVLKLAGLVQYLASGNAGHVVTRSQVRDFFEQLVVQLHDFPQPPADYRRQQDEPDLQSPGRHRLVVGISGAGKTTWASRAALECPNPVAYFDVGELPGAALATSLARELVARFLSGPAAGAGAAALPVASGLELLALLSDRLRNAGLDVMVVLDNVHRVSAGTLRSLVEAAPDVRFVLLGQTWPGQAELEAHLGIKAELLGGWTLDAVVATFASAGCPITAITGLRVLGLTAGAPLYVKATARLAAEQYAGDVDGFLDAVDRRLALVQTVQEVLLADSYQQLTSSSRSGAGLLDLSDVALEREEVMQLFQAAGESPTSAATAIRELVRSGVVQLIQGGAVKLHDAYRLLARDNRAALPTEIVEATQERLVTILQDSLSHRWTVGRFGLWVRLLPQTGRLSTLIDVASHEQFHQVGHPSELKAALESAAHAPELDEEQQFWALDSLVLWEHTDNLYERIPDLVAQMAARAGAHPDPDIGAALAMKQMLAAALNSDPDGVANAYAAGLQYVNDNPTVSRILQYNRALSLYQLGSYDEAESAAFGLILDYYDYLDLDVQDVLFTNPEHIRSVVPDVPTRDDDLRRTADCLTLLASTKRHTDQSGAALVRVHALKFYSAALAFRSAVHAGQEAVDELLAHGGPDEARHVLESLVLPLVTHYQLSDLLVAVRGQYAVVLAWCGEHDAARQEIATLQAYVVGELGARELANQRELIEQIVAGTSTRPSSPTSGS